MAEVGEAPERDVHQAAPAAWAGGATDQLFRLLVSAVRDYAILALDPTGRFLSWNDGARRLYGYRADQVLGSHFSVLYTPEDQARRHPEDELRIARERGTFEEEGWRVRLDGSRFWASMVLTRIEEGGRLLGFAKVVRDMTEKREALNAELERQRRDLELSQARQREEELQLLANSIPQLAWIADETGAITWYNQRWYEYTGTTPDQMQGWGWQSVHHPDRLPGVLARFQQAVASGEPWEDTFPLRSRQGEWRWFLSRAVPIRGKDGRASRWFGTNTDVTSQVELARQRDRLLKDVEFERARFEAVMQQMPAAVIVGEAPSGKLVFANSRMNAVWGHPLIPSQSVEQYADWTGFHVGGRPYQPNEWPLARAIRTGEVVDAEEVAIVWPTGERRTLRLSAAPVRGGDGQILAGVVICQDVTDEETSHRRLAESEASFRSILENSPALIFMKDGEGRYVVVNPALARFLGRDERDVVGRTDVELFPGDFAQGLRANDDEVRQSKAGKQMEERFGDRTYLTVKFPVLDQTGEVQFVGGISTDISDRKRAEAELRTLTAGLERMVEQRTHELVVSNKELEAFSYSVSHDLRAPLRAIDGFSKALVEDHGALLPADAQELLSDVREAAQRMAGLIDDLLRLSRVTRAPLTRSPVDLSRLAEGIVANLRRMDARRQVQVHIQAGLSADGDPALIRIGLENLLANAWKFTSRTAAAEIWFGEESLDGERVFYVRDNGAGFDMAYADKLFVSFQRLHAMADFPGTGIGLATVQRVVHRHGGRAWAVGASGQGATFRFTLGNGGAAS